ncbi:hypothetical protein [Salinibacter phage M31CR41-2]|uniref:Uncharacterized protein n=1 Tax=Salinibacter phage M31CR41-2 TaxID=2681614 RepID=A0A2I6UHB1_9CAUD|nr:hypothetical protein FGG68_gp08 [Salinibacter phage M31CR41-2]AUO79331.1 hypothetical protein [Salinibacter phage M31CR41-2]
MTEFGRGERVEIVKHGPLREKTGTVMLADPYHLMYCVKLDNPTSERRLVILHESDMMQEVFFDE